MIIGGLGVVGPGQDSPAEYWIKIRLETDWRDYD